MMKLFQFSIALFFFSQLFCAPSTASSRFVLEEITSPSLKGNLLGDPATRKLWVYLPPSYDTSPDKRYPSVYMLHGYSGNYMYFKEMFYHQCRIGHIADELILKKLIQEAIIILPDGLNAYGGSFYETSEVIGDYRTYIAEELVNFIDQNYRTIADRKYRGIGGHSMGGHGAITLGMEYHDVFGSIAAIGPGLVNAESKPTRADKFFQENPKSIGFPLTDWNDVKPGQIQFATNMAYAIAAIVSPDINNPPYYLNLPFIYPEKTLITEEWVKWVDFDLLHRIARNGHKLAKSRVFVVKGAGETTLWQEAPCIEMLPPALREVGVTCTYMETEGDHITHLHEQVRLSLLFLLEEQSALGPGTYMNYD